MIVGLAVAASLALAAAPQKMQLARPAKVGDVSKLRLTAEIDLAGTPVVITALVVETVSKVEPNGDYTIESKQTEGRAKYGLNDGAMPDSPARSASYRASGELIDIPSADAQGIDVRVARMNSFVAPADEVKNGQTWTHSYPPSPRSNNVAGIAEYTFTGTEKEGVRTLAVVKFSYRETSGEKPAKSSGKMWIDTSTGALVKLEAEWIDAPFANSPAPMNAKIRLQREG